jgi:hypothetical protein
VSHFTASGALLLEEGWARDFRAKLGAAFRVMRLTDCEWESALPAKLTEWAAHFRGFCLCFARTQSRKVGFFFVGDEFCFCFIVPDISVS